MKTFKIFGEHSFLPFTTIITFKRAIHKIKDVKELKMRNVRYTHQYDTQCVIWMAEGHPGTPVQRTLFTKYRITVLSRRTINLWYQIFNGRGSQSERRGNEKSAVEV